MATLTYKDGTSTKRGANSAGTPGVEVFDVTINMADLSAQSLTTADDIPLFDLPAGSIVLSSSVEVLSASDSTTGTLDIGTTGTEVTQVANPDATGYTLSSTASSYAAGGTVSIRAGTATVTNGKFRVIVAAMLGG